MTITEKNKYQKKKPRNKAAYALMAFLTVLLLANIYIRVATPRVNLYEEGRRALGIHHPSLYTLPEGTYTILGEFSTEFGSTSHITFSAIERKYFNLLVTDAGGDQFIIAARVQDRELQALEEGRSVELKGLGAQLIPELADMMYISLGDTIVDITGYCIYDNRIKAI